MHEFRKSAAIDLISISGVDVRCTHYKDGQGVRDSAVIDLISMLWCMHYKDAQGVRDSAVIDLISMLRRLGRVWRSSAV
jgi:hypothetical protein